MYFFQIKDGRSVLQKRNVLGCYLGRDLPFVRHCADIFHRAVIVIYPWKTGTFDKSEDEVILKAVDKGGRNKETFDKLSKILRRRAYNIYDHYNVIAVENHSAGNWSFAEDKTLLTELFKNKANSDVDFIESLSIQDLKPIAEKLSRSLKSVNERWTRKMKPILLSYHNGRLHQNWKYKFLNYLIERRIKWAQEVDWTEAKLLFPDQNTALMGFVMSHIVLKNKALPIYKVIRNRLPAFKRRDQFNSEKSRKYREDIVHDYNKVRGVTCRNRRQQIKQVLLRYRYTLSQATNISITKYVTLYLSSYLCVSLNEKSV